MTTVQVDPLTYYASIGAALFPIPAGQKGPGSKEFWPVTDAAGNVTAGSFKHNNSTDPEQWKAWRTEHPGCNFGIVAFASRLIIVDIDTSLKDEITDPIERAEKLAAARVEAWATWCELCAQWGVPVLQPHVQSQGGGWHVLCAVPTDVDASSLSQPDAVKKRINVRCIGYTVAAGSYFEGRPYVLMSDADPHPAPAALVEHCTRKTPVARTPTLPGARDKGDVAALLRWLNEHDAFADYESWFQIGMALKLEYGDDGFDLWALCHDETVTADAAASKWESFATDPDGQSVTLNTFLDRAHKLGWRGSVRKSTSAMFDSVAQLAAASGATLSSAAQTRSLVGNTQKIIAEIGQPILDNFLQGTQDVPTRPTSSKYPTLPADSMSEHPLFDLMCTAIDRIVTMVEIKPFRQQRVFSAFKVLRWMHEPTYNALVDFIAVSPHATLSPNEMAKHNKNFEVAIATASRQAESGQRGLYTDSKGKPDAQISDNVGIFLGMTNVQLQYDEFKRREIEDNKPFDQSRLDQLWSKAKSVDYQLHVGKELFHNEIKVIARSNRFDSLRDRVDSLEMKWDGAPRLDSWLTRCVGVANDVYHTVVGRNLIGGMVRRARYAGCTQAETVIFISPAQGTGKSTLCKILALEQDWYLGSYKLGGTQQNSLPLLAGKWVVELSELAGLNKTAFEDIKTLLTETVDEYVAKYEAVPTAHPRRCCFIGTSNVRQPLADPSGNRRFLPVHVPGKIDLEWLQANIEQLIGEAAARDTRGEQFAVPEETFAITTAQQEAARGMTAVEEAIHDWFDREGALYCLAGDVGRALKMAGFPAQTRYGVFMEKLGWRDYSPVIEGKKTRIWIKNGTGLTGSICLEPAQAHVNGRVEMRMRQAAGVLPCPVPLPQVPGR